MVLTSFRRLLSDERGIAMVVVILAVMVVTILGASLFVSSVRDLDSSTSVQRASTALGIAEAGVQRALLALKTFGPTSKNISKLYADDSCAPDPNVPSCQDSVSPGQGRWMNPDDPNTALNERTVTPTVTDHFVGNAGTGFYRTYIRAVNPIKLPSVREGVYEIVSVGFDRRDRPTRPGERTVQQFVRVELHDLPFGLFSQSTVDLGGNPKVLNESLWVDGDVFQRNKVSFTAESPADPDCKYPVGCDLFYGWDGALCGESPAGADKCPNTVHATGTIYKGNGTGGDATQGPIHRAPFPAGYQNCEFPYDRDSKGGPYSPPGWTCAPTSPDPPYSSSLAPMIQDFPFKTEGPSDDTYQFFKQIAQASGTFCTHSSSATLIIQGNGTGACDIDKNTIPEGFFVLYVEATPGAGDVAVKFGWGQQSDQPDQLPACDPQGNFGVVIVRNANLDWQTNETWWGAIFVPEGTFFGSGTGAGGWIVGTIFAKNITWKGNSKVQLNDCWIDDIAGPWFSVSRLRWHESDR